MLNAITADILSDFSDETGEALVSEEYVRRALERALAVAGFDLGVTYTLEEDGIVPVMPAAHREVWSLRAKILVCRLLRAQASTRLDFSSGDKRVNRSQEAKHWGDLEKSLLADYMARVKRINPAADESLIQLEAQPLIYTQNRRLYNGE